MYQDSQYRTKDLYLAAYLVAEGQTLDRVEREGKVCWFTFAERQSSEQLANFYWGGTGQCYGLAYAEAIRTLKDRIFSV